MALRWCHHNSKHPKVPQIIGGWATIVIYILYPMRRPPTTAHHLRLQCIRCMMSILRGLWGGVATASYHELRTLLDRWVAPGPGLPTTLPPDPKKPTKEDTTSW
ncbi:hypothetical protein HAX54_052732, partial [Datura stramonium]|nr:hypothetical protein [Datura stramonium]